MKKNDEGEICMCQTFVSCYSQMQMNQEKAQVQANEEM